ncbi:MAG: DUF4349 domain-containing protein [Arachnia sp.]
MKRICEFRRIWVLVVVLLMSAMFAGCSSASDSPMLSSGEQAPAPENADMGVPQEDGTDTGGDAERLVIRTKTMRLEVEKTTEAMDDIRTLTSAHSGTVSDLQVATDSDEPIYRYNQNGFPEGDGTALRGWVTVRVPTESYEDFVTAVADLGIVKFQSEASSDVTQEYVDLSARLENLRAQEERLREFFEAATDVEDMLAVETELGRVRGEIESLDAQVTYLERQAAMATITVELTEPRDVVRPGGESWGFVDAITTGIRGAAALMTGLLTFLIASAPLWIVGLVGFFVLRAVLRRRRASTGPPLPSETTTPTQAPPSTDA